jgi:hypothetical protein
MAIHWLWSNRKVSLPGQRIDSKTLKIFKEQLYTYAKNHDMCKSLIDSKYLKTSILNAKYLLISKTDESIEGFVIIEFKNDDLHIPLICSNVKGSGTKMLDTIFDYVNSHSNINSITLESIPESFGFYEKKGFDIYCPEGELCPMIYKKK